MLKTNNGLFKKEFRKTIIKECQKITRCPYWYNIFIIFKILLLIVMH